MAPRWKIKVSFLSRKGVNIQQQQEKKKVLETCAHASGNWGMNN